MKERKYRAVGWSVSEIGRKLEKFMPGLGMFFREGEMFAISPYLNNYKEVLEAIQKRREQLRNFGKAGSVVFDVESDTDQEYLDSLEF